MFGEGDEQLTLFAALACALGGGGDQGNFFPQSDVIDIANGASWIPTEVTEARRLGKQVEFFHTGNREDWYWILNGKKIVHG